MAGERSRDAEGKDIVLYEYLIKSKFILIQFKFLRCDIPYVTTFVYYLCGLNLNNVFVGSTR